MKYMNYRIVCDIGTLELVPVIADACDWSKKSSNGEQCSNRANLAVQGYLTCTVYMYV